MKKGKTTTCGIAVVMLISLMVSCANLDNSSALQGAPERGVITDRNGIVLVSNDSVILSDSAGAIVARNYPHPTAAQLIGYVGKATEADVNNDDGYAVGDIIGKAGVEKFYDKILRVEEGRPGKNLKLTIDYELQKLGEELMEGKTGCVVAIEPSTGEVLCMVSSPSYNPQLLSGNASDSVLQSLQQDSLKPLLNRCIMGQYKPSDVFKAARGLVLMSENIISTQTRYPCEKGFEYRGLRIGCHDHSSPLTLAEALRTACSSYFYHGFLDMMNNPKYETVRDAYEKWYGHIISLGFGSPLGIDLPGEKRGLIPNNQFYDTYFRGRWSAFTILCNAVAQVTPLQLANLSAVIANRGHYYIPHVVKEIQGEEIGSPYTTARRTTISREAYDAIIDGMRLPVDCDTCSALAGQAIEARGLSGVASSRVGNHPVFIGFAPVNNPKIAIAVYIEVYGKEKEEEGKYIGCHLMQQFIKGNHKSS